MNADTIKALATYFNGASVGHQSVCLELPSPHREEADRFFAMRQRLGIHGYVSAEQATAAIERALT